MKFSHLDRLVFDGLAEELKPLGFKSRWSNWDFRRAEPWGKVGLHMYFYTYPNQRRISGELLVRIDEVQEMVGPFLKDRAPKLVKELSTLSKEISQHMGQFWEGAVIGTESDIPAAIGAMKWIVCDVLMPFAEKHHRVEDA